MVAPKKVALTDGFLPHASGLIVPESVARKRIVSMKVQHRALNACVSKVLGPLSLRFALGCMEDGCPSPEIVRVPQPDGGIILQCGCTDRVFSGSF